MTTLNVGTLRLRSGEGDRVALRLRTARALQAADLVPAGLPPASVLVVRQLADPLPRRFGAGRVRPRVEWERAVRGTLEAAVRSARRPDEAGRIDPAADVVLFEDEAQLLACLIVALVRGNAGSIWWWSLLLARLQLPIGDWRGAPGDPASILAVKPQGAPAAIAWITRWREAVPVARACSIDGARRCVAALVGAYGLPPAMAGDDVDRAESSVPQSMEAVEQPTGHDATRARRPLVFARWLACVPREMARASVPLEVQRLFGVALGLHHGTAPARDTTIVPEAGRQAAGARVRHTVERRRVRTSAEAAATGEDEFQQPTRTRSTIGAVARQRVTASGSSADASSGLPNAGMPDRSELHSTGPASSQARRTRSPAGDKFTKKPAAIEHERLTGRVPQRQPPLAGHRHSKEPLTHRVRAGRVQPPTPAVQELPATFSTEGVVTRFCGVFYLIHVLQALNVPAAFDRAWRLEETGGAWGTLDLIARALIGGRFRQDDPIWEALGHLAGWPARHREVAGAALLPAASQHDPAFAAPPRWRGELDDPLEHLAWSVTGDRLCLWSQKGYLLGSRRTMAADRDAAVRRACRTHVQGARSPAALTSAPAHAIPWMPPARLPRGCRARLGRWAAAVAPAVLRRLQLALDGSVDALRSRRAVHRALAVPGRLYVTSSHVDVVIPLQRIDLSVRRAGLDRDPGWLPSFGRVVYFHFE